MIFQVVTKVNGVYIRRDQNIRIVNGVCQSTNYRNLNLIKHRSALLLQKYR